MAKKIKTTEASREARINMAMSMRCMASKMLKKSDEEDRIARQKINQLRDKRK
jgi:hypothetical protein